MNEQIITKPLPEITDIDQEFWNGAQKDQFLIQKCMVCGQLQFFPRPVCVRCFSPNLGWQECQGKGTIYSFTLVRVPAAPAYRKEVEATGIPVILVMIDLDEGLRIISQLVDCSPDEVAIGARVKVVFPEVENANFKLPKFTLEK